MEISKHETEWLESEGAKMLLDLGVKQGDNVVDYGCGEGRYTIPLSQIVGKQGCVYSVEQDENAIATVQKRLPQFSNLDIVKFLNVSRLETSEILQENSIDAIFVFDALQYIQDWDLLFRYFFKIVKPSGLVCIYPAAVTHPGDVDIKLAISKMEAIGLKYIKSNEYQMMHNIDMVNDIVYSFRLL